MEAKKRDSNIELLRVVSILMIIASHCIQHGGAGNFELYKSDLSINYIINVLFGSWAQVGVAVFVIITSWYMEQKQINYTKIIKLVLQTWTTCILITAIVYGLGLKPISLKIIAMEFITPFYEQYWFISTYIMFYLLIPVLQIVIKKLGNEKLKSLCIVLTFFIPIYNFFFTNVGGNLANFCYLYLVTIYLKNNKGNIFERHNKKMFFGMLALMSVIIIVLRVGLEITGIGSLFNLMLHVSFRGNLFVYVAAINMFYCFKNMRIGYISVINKLGKATFGVYIIHGNLLMRYVENGSRALLWGNIWYEKPFNLMWNYGEIYYFIYYFLAVVAIWLVCSIIEIIRTKVIDNMIIDRIKLIDNVGNYLNVKLNYNMDK